MPITFPGRISKISTMADRTLRWQIDMSRELSDEEMAQAFKFRGTDASIAFKESPFTDEEVLDLPDAPFEKQKTPSQRLRGVLYRIWEQQKLTEHGEQNFEVFYRYQMEMIINAEKEKLQDQKA